MPDSRGSSHPATDFERDGQVVTVKRLSSGYYHLRGVGPCNWAQPSEWPCDPDDLAFFGEAEAPFRRAVLAENAALKGNPGG